MLISIENGLKQFGDRMVLQGINLTVEDNDRIGLIGVNGSGKTTLIKLLLGIEELTDGEISRRSGLTIGYLAQNNGLEAGNTIREEMRSVFSDLLALEQELREMEQRMAASQDEHDALASEYAEKLAQFEARDGYLIDVKINTVLQGMGFADRSDNTVVSVLSGGEKTRLAIAKLLLEEPQLLVLDEPTNHLDFQTLLWLEEYLQKYKYALLIVSHDRYFLDKLVTSVCEIDRTRLTRYKGNYTKFTQLREEQRARQMKEYEAQQKEIAELEDYVARNLVRASTTKMAQSRRTRLEKMERIERPNADPKAAHFRFTYDREPFKDLLYADNLSLQVGEPPKVICRGINLDIKRGDKVAFIGQNGIGKTTLLRTLQGLQKPASGSFRWCDHVKISYYDQELKTLNPDKLVIDELWDRFRFLKEVEVRSLLASVLLTGDNVYKKVGVISGGERAKLMFAIMSLERGNVLVLDEPTNHLDMATREVLEEALAAYEGSIIMVSHDRYFLNRVATRIVEMFEDHVDAYEGNYDAYLARKTFLEQRALAARPVVQQVQQKAPEKQSAGNYRTKEQKQEDARRRQQVRSLEKELEELETQIGELEQSLNDPEIYAQYEKMQEITDELNGARERYDQVFDEWSSLAE